MFKTKRKLNKGFSLLEMIVSLAVFAIVAVVAAGALLTIIDAGRKAQAMKSVINNLHYALESMSREIRMGTKFHCNTNLNPSIVTIKSPQNCSLSSPGIYFAFESSEERTLTNTDDRYAYRFDASTGQLQKAETGGIGISGSDFVPVTSSEVEITDLKFVVTGSAPGDNDPARVLIMIKGYAGTKSKLRTEFSMQTTVSQRVRE